MKQRLRMDKSDVVMAIVVIVTVGCAGFWIYAQIRAMTEFDAWCHLQGGQVAGRDADVCVDREGKVILP